MDALACGPLNHGLSLMRCVLTMTTTVKALEKRGVVQVVEQRAWRGQPDGTSLSSAQAQRPEHLTEGQQRALAAIDEAG